MSREAVMRSRVIEILTMAGCNPTAVENPACPGTPDVNYVQGWVELKQIKDWPARAATPVRIEHFTPQQRIWLRNRRMCGGIAYLLLRVNTDWLLFDGRYAADALGQVNKATLIENAVAFWPRKLNEQELVKWLKTTPPQS